MLEREIFDTIDYSKPNQAKTDMADNKTPKMDVSNYSNILLDEENETNNSLQVDPNATVSDTVIPEQNQQQTNESENQPVIETTSLDQAQRANQEENKNTVSASNQTNQFPIDTLEQSPNNEVPENNTESNQKAVQEMVTDTSELSQLKLIQSNFENLSEIEKNIIEKRIAQLESDKSTDERTSDTDLKSSFPVARIIPSDEDKQPIGSNSNDIADFITSIKNPPIWRVL